ncbi:glucose-1-phosphate cytidylyltransferase [Caulobacter sp. BE254]|uniref:glucose-1-phosphate cytidylyltransferase n=1 Tax=Caulobacter sp. BE254 TaxID=2817720 RepID=UPI00285C0714|nr:glucose-1-phosphate cytidylyltransferase [Caulobacter sp. BE254]MDR7117313.1 glucose-1-phosphate cytidylyltransferase [Caulobacter sp. BE254]
MTKAVILAGGLGTRLSEETGSRPKPMVEIGGMPILWHIMKMYDAHGIRDFVVCLGYKGYVIKEFFHNYFLHRSDVTIDLRSNSVEVHAAKAEPWRITLVETGELTQTGGRIKRILPYVADDPYFCLTYGDGVGDVDIGATLAKHQAGDKLATICAAQPPGRFGSLTFDGDAVTGFQEKPAGDGGWINCGFFVLSPKIGDYIEGDTSIWEQEPLEGLARDRQLQAHLHDGFWQPMDTVRDRAKLEELWASGQAPWKRW